MSSSLPSAVSSVGFAELSRLGGIGCLLQPGLFYLRIQKSMREEFNLLIKPCATWTVPAAETKTIGLQADASARWRIMVFARHLDKFIMRDNFVPSIGTLPSGKLYRDTEILPTYRDFAKTHANP